MKGAWRKCAIPLLVAAFWACTPATTNVPGEPCRAARESQTSDVSHRYHYADGSVYRVIAS